MKQIFYFLFLSLILFACNTNKQVINSDENIPQKGEKIKVLMNSKDSLRIDPFEIDSLKIVDDRLEIFVNYSGGCGEANFDLYRTNRIMESMPPKTILYLAFTDDDPCRSIEIKKLTFDLEPFKRFADRGGIFLKISGTNKMAFYNISK
jgi:hypothetical protein